MSPGHFSFSSFSYFLFKNQIQFLNVSGTPLGGGHISYIPPALLSHLVDDLPVVLQTVEISIEGAPAIHMALDRFVAILVHLLLQQAYCMTSQSFHGTGKAQLFLRGSLDIDSVFRNLQISSNVFHHLRNVILQLWFLCDHGYIHIGDPVAVFLYQLHHMAQQHSGIRSFVLGIGIREMLADIPQS